MISKMFSLSHILQPVAIGVLSAIALALLLRVILKKRKRKMPKRKSTASAKATGILFGKQGRRIVCSPEKEEGHVFVNGPSGTGKTSALVIPTLQNWHGTSFTIDISGDISKNVNMPHTLIFEPGNLSSLPYNIFYIADQAETISDRYEQLEQLAFLLMPNQPKADEVNRFFRDGGRKILTASLIAYYEAGADFIEICEIITSTSCETLLENLSSCKNEIIDRYIGGFFGSNEKNTAGCKQEVDTCLKLFSTNEKVMQSIRRPRNGEQSVSPQMVEDHNLFVKIDDTKLELYSPLLHILISQMMDFFASRSNDAKTPVLFCLDEFASFGKLEITPALRKLRKKKVRILVLTQSLADVDLIYGREERISMMNNFVFKVVLGATDTDTQDYFSRLIGEEEVEKLTRIKGSNGNSISQTSEFRRYVRPEALAHLGDDLLLLSPAGWQKLKKNFYFR